MTSDNTLPTTVSRATENTSSFDSSEIDLSAIQGRYFTTVSLVPARHETYKEEARGFNREKADEFGEIEQTLKVRRDVPEGLTLLATRMRFLDEVLHSIEFAAHPQDEDQRDLVFMADEFFTYFKPELEFDAIRDREIETVRLAIADSQQRLAAPPRQSEATALLPKPGQREPSTTDLVRARSKADDLASRVERTQEIAQLQAEHINSVVAEISSHTTTLSRFYTEKARSSLALVQDQIDFAKGLMQGLATLSLYTGEDVEVRTMSEGNSASPDLPLTLYQEVLFLDEEIAVDAAIGGFDYKKLHLLPDYLDPKGTILQRLIPAERGAVLVRIRRNDKFYSDDAYENFILNQMNQSTGLLVRDGENVHLVHSELTTEKADRLFPTRKEIEDIFKSFGRKITPDHLDYAKAKSNFERTTVNYKRMLLMLWGLHDRLKLFGDFVRDEAFDGWYDEHFHAERLTYVHDGEKTLTLERPSYLEWVNEKNRMIQSGSRLGCIYDKMITFKSAPKCYTNPMHRDAEAIYKPVAVTGVSFVDRSNGRLTITIPVQHAWKRDRKETNARIDLVRAMEERHDVSALCLDNVTVEELDYYLQSRKERRHYLDYIDLFAGVRAILAAEEEVMQPVIAAIDDEIAHQVTDGVLRQEAIRRAIALWRTQNNHVVPGSDEWGPSERRVVAELAYALCGFGQSVWDRVVDEMPDIRPIELRVDSQGKFWLYRELSENEKPEASKVIEDVFVGRNALRIGGRRLSLASPVQIVNLSKPEFDPRKFRDDKRHPVYAIHETPIGFDPDRREAWTNQHLAYWIDAKRADQAVSHLKTDHLAALRSLDARVIAEAIELVMEESKGHVRRTRLYLPCALVLWEQNGKKALRVAGLHLSGLSGLALLSDEGEHFARRLISRYFARPETHLAEISKLVEGRNKGELETIFRPCLSTLVTAEKAWVSQGYVIDLTKNETEAVSTGKFAPWSTKKEEVYADWAEAIKQQTVCHGRKNFKLLTLNDVLRSACERSYASMLNRLNDGESGVSFVPAY